MTVQVLENLVFMSVVYLSYNFTYVKVPNNLLQPCPPRRIPWIWFWIRFTSITFFGKHLPSFVNTASEKRALMYQVSATRLALLAPYASIALEKANPSLCPSDIEFRVPQCRRSQ